MSAEEIIQGLLLPTEITVRSSRQTWSVLKMQRAEYPELYDGLAKLDETTDEEALFEFLEDVVYRKAEPEMRHLSGLKPRESRELDRAALDFTNGKYRYAASLICLMHSSGDLHSQRIRSTSLAGGQAEHPGFRPAHHPPWLHRTLLGELRGYLPSANNPLVQRRNICCPRCSLGCRAPAIRRSRSFRPGKLCRSAPGIREQFPPWTRTEETPASVRKQPQRSALRSSRQALAVYG